MATSPHEQPHYRFGLYEVLPESGELFRQGQRVKIQEQPFRLLIALLERPGEIVTRESLSQRLWPGDTFVEFDQSLGAAVMKLRQTLQDDADNPLFVETIPRRGFRFIAPVTQTGNVASQAVGSDRANSMTPGDMPAERQQRLPIAWLTLFLGLACVVAILLAGLWRYFLPVEPPKIVATSQATHDGILKEGLLTDGPRVYMEENRGSSRALVQASTTGGESVPIPNGFGFVQLQDVSPSGSELLITSGLPNDREGETWALGLPSGARRRLSNVMSHGGAWSRDGRQLIFANGPELFLANADGTNARKLSGTPGIPFGPRFSPDGRRVRFAVNSEGEISTLWEIRTNGSGLHRLFSAGLAPASQCCGVWSADGRYYFFIGAMEAGGNIWAVRETSGLLPERESAPVQLTTGLLSFGALAPSPDGKKLYVEAFQSRTELVRYDVKSKQFAPYLSGISAGEVDFSRDAQWVTYISYPERTLWRSRVDGSDRLQLTHASLFAVLPKWSPDGAQIAFAGEEPGKPWRVFVISSNGGTPREVHEENLSQIDVNWSPDGKSLVYGRITTPGIAFSRIATAGSTEKLELTIVNLNSNGVSVVPGSENLFSPRWSPDGRYIAALGQSSKKLMLYDFETRRWSDLVSESGNIAFPKWSQDSKYVYYDLHSPERGTSWRIKFDETRPELIADSTALQRFISPHVGPWSGLAPDGSLLFVRDLSTDEIYALELLLP